MADEPGKVDVVNLALAHLGQEPVAGLDQASLDQSNAARKVLRQLDTARDTVLARHGWTCALTFTTLTPDPTAPATAKWPYTYSLPGDALRVWQVDGCAWPRWDEARWQVGTTDLDVGARRVIRSRDGTSLDVGYVRRALYAALDPHVREAIAADAAAKACWSVTGDQSRADRLKPAAEEAVLLALSVDGTQESAGDSEAPSEFAALRRSCG